MQLNQAASSLSEGQGSPNGAEDDIPNGNRIMDPGNGPESDEEEDLLQVRGAKGEYADPDHAAADAQPADEPKKKKRKKLRIKPETLSANRVVFDDEGGAVDPLAALAAATDSRYVRLSSIYSWLSISVTILVPKKLSHAKQLLAY